MNALGGFVCSHWSSFMDCSHCSINLTSHLLVDASLSVVPLCDHVTAKPEVTSWVGEQTSCSESPRSTRRGRRSDDVTLEATPTTLMTTPAVTTSQ